WAFTSEAGLHYSKFTPSTPGAPQLRSAVTLFFGQANANALADPNRATLVALTDDVLVLPATSPPTTNNIRTKTAHPAMLPGYINQLKQSFRDWQQAFTRANTWASAARGIFWRQPGEDSPDQIAADGAYRRLLSTVNLMRRMGAPSAVMQPIYDAIRKVLRNEA